MVSLPFLSVFASCNADMRTVKKRKSLILTFFLVKQGQTSVCFKPVSLKRHIHTAKIGIKQTNKAKTWDKRAKWGWMEQMRLPGDYYVHPREVCQCLMVHTVSFEVATLYCASSKRVLWNSRNPSVWLVSQRVCVKPPSDRSAVKGAEELILGSGHLRQALITMATMTWTDSSPWQTIISTHLK